MARMLSIRFLTQRHWLLVALPVAALVAGAATAVAMVAGSATRSARPAVIGDPANRSAGTLNAQAVTDAHAFADLPVPWLGEQFNGLNLVALQYQVNPLPATLPWARGRTNASALILVYGTCAPRAADEVNCDPPLEIYVSGPGSSPPIEQLKLLPGWATPTSVRGVPAIDKGIGTELFFDNGLSVTVYSDSSLRGEALDALTIANAAALGLQPVEAGANLEAVGNLVVPEPT